MLWPHRAGPLVGRCGHTPWSTESTEEKLAKDANENASEDDKSDVIENSRI